MQMDVMYMGMGGGGGGLVDLQMPVTFDDGQSKLFKPILVKF